MQAPSIKIIVLLVVKTNRISEPFCTHLNPDPEDRKIKYG